MKLLVYALLLSMPFSIAGFAKESQRPMHHTDEGFRNYPVLEDSPSLGFKFYWKRFISSFS